MHSKSILMFTFYTGWRPTREREYANAREPSLDDEPGDAREKKCRAKDEIKKRIEQQRTRFELYYNSSAVISLSTVVCVCLFHMGHMHRDALLPSSSGYVYMDKCLLVSKAL